MVNISKTQQSANENAFDRESHWVVFINKTTPESGWRKIPCGSSLKKMRSRQSLDMDNDKIVTQNLANKSSSFVSHVVVDKSISSFSLLTLARKLLKPHLDFDPRQIAFAAFGFDEETTNRLGEAFCSACLAAAANMPAYKSEKSKDSSLRRVKLYGYGNNRLLKRAEAEAEGNALARELSILPPNKLTPGDYLKKVRVLARENKWKLQFLDVKELKRKKAGAFLAVAQGSPKDDAGIVKLTYDPGRPSRKKLALVGKGICYDTGGTNLKPQKFMFGMHEDMQGSAVALGTFLALSRLKVPFRMECWLALAMNHIGPKAYKPNDVVTASDGTNIEVVHTDAEGRMVLADTLIMASKQKPSLIIDYATLTGACVYSLGTAYSGIFSNQEDSLQTLIAAGKDSGERVWPFPLDDDYDEAIKSDIADVKQCSMEGSADHILATRFLKRFVKHDTPWIHVDLSSGNNKGGLAHIPTDTTGFGVRYTVNLLLDHKMI